MSAVRSSPTFLKTDIRHALGFVASPKRLNVALTRARALLIILGNPHVLAKDLCWREVLEYCVKHGGYIGCDLPTRYSSLTLDDSEWERGENLEYGGSYCALFTTRLYLHHYSWKADDLHMPFLLYFIHSFLPYIHGEWNGRYDFCAHLSSFSCISSPLSSVLSWSCVLILHNFPFLVVSIPLTFLACCLPWFISYGKMSL